ncbi:MAG TPA: PQQ-like beta-propeller repeat protein [Candidatus Hydrogenedentes bacterium]|nr:PQQ-like beta-propeller repeat protein [Candidatus Hydrogenedentota bacterium]HQM47624.1 PQQ-like beta-propeller repeat protein [Candidatus Hydrogenedentota bacterium]
MHGNGSSLRQAFALVILTVGGWHAAASDWPQWRGPNRDGAWAETGLVSSFSAPQIPLKWRATVSNGYSGPTVAAGRVYVTDRVEAPEETERVLCFDAETGAPVWVHAYAAPYGPLSYKDGPRASVTIADGLAYSLGAVGHLRCLDAASGELVWKKDPGAGYEVELPTWGIAAAPLVDGELVIAQIGARNGGCLMAWDKRTGQERWRALDDPASYSAPVVTEQAGRRVVICWTGDNVAGLNPLTGELYWKVATPRSRDVINVPTPVIAGDRMFLTSVYEGSYLFRLGQDAPTVELLWHRAGESEIKSDAIHAMISTPLMLGEYVYGVDCYGQVRCLEPKNGDRVWEDLTLVPQRRWGTIHMVQNGATTWMFNETGELIIATLSPEGCRQISRAQLIGPTTGQLGRGDGVCWSHPAYANRCVFARNDQELVCADLAAE